MPGHRINPNPNDRRTMSDQTADFPAAPVPPDCDLRGLPGFMLDAERLLSSELWVLSDGPTFKAAVALWCRAWRQVPAASLPDNDDVLRGFAGMAPAPWRKSRALALRGFVKCSDGRLYHKTLAEDALSAWTRRTAHREEQDHTRERKRLEREDRQEMFAALRQDGKVPAFDTPTRDLRALVTDLSRVTGSACHALVTDRSRLRQGQGQGQGQGVGGATPTPPTPPTPSNQDSLTRQALVAHGLPSNPQALEEWVALLTGPVVQADTTDDGAQSKALAAILAHAQVRGVTIRYARDAGPVAAAYRAAKEESARLANRPPKVPEPPAPTKEEHNRRRLAGDWNAAELAGVRDGRWHVLPDGSLVLRPPAPGVVCLPLPGAKESPPDDDQPPAMARAAG